MAQSGLLDFIQGIAVLRIPESLGLTVCSDDDEVSALVPQLVSNRQRVDLVLFPPEPLITTHY
jgi:hypothetical protein